MLKKMIGILIVILPLTSTAAIEWDSREMVDEFTDSKQTLAYIIGEKGSSVIFVCADKKLDVTFSTGEYLGDKNDADNFTYRVDKNESVSMKLISRNDLVLAMDRDVVLKIIEEFSAGKEQLLIGLYDYRYSLSTVKFTFKNFKPSIEKVITACK